MPDPQSPSATARAGGPRSAVVVVSFASSGLLPQALAAWNDPRPDDPLIVVVDNHSDDTERERVARLGRRYGWTVLVNDLNVGFGAAVAQGVDLAREAGCDTVVLLNPDARIDRTTAEQLVEHVRAQPSELVAPRILDSAGCLYSAGSVVYRDSGRIRSLGRPVPAGSRASAAVPWVSGACLAVHLDLWDRVGGMTDDLFLYWEDVDLSLRVQEAGGTVAVRDDLVAVHDEGGTQGRSGRAKSALYYRWNCRNRLVVGARTLGRRDLWRWVAATPSVTREILLRGGRRQLVRRPGLVWSAVRGSVEGLLIAAPALLRGGGRPRVLVVHPSAELYGSDRVLLESAAALADRADVLVVLPEHGPLVDLLRDRGIAVSVRATPVLRKSDLRPSGFLRLVALTLRSLPGTCSTILRAGRDGVYVNTLTVPTWPVMARLLGRRVTSHVHEAEGSAPRWLRRGLAAPVRCAHQVLVNSRFSADVLLDAAPGLARRVVLVPNAVPGPPSVRPPRAQLTGGVRLLYVGRLSPRKGVHIAVDLLADLVEHGMDARLELWGSVFTGYEWYEAQLRQQVQDRGLGERTVFAGFRPDVWPGLAAADVVLVPSMVDEPFGNTAVEAVLAARPVVVSDSSGLREAAHGYASARLVPPGDVPAWSAAVRGIVEQWAVVREEVVRDAEEAAARHAPAVYRRRVADLVLGDSGTLR